MSAFESSDEDESKEYNSSPLNISWLDLSTLGCDEVYGICSLPGCKFKDTWRSLENDIKCLQNEEVKDIFCLCSKGELNKYRVPHLLTSLAEGNITVHHFHFPDGETPSIHIMVKLIEELKVCIMNQRKPVIHCYGGLGRSCVVAACCLLQFDSNVTSEQAIDKMRELRGPRAVQSVRQYNYIHDFRKKIDQYNQSVEENDRSLSR